MHALANNCRNIQVIIKSTVCHWWNSLLLSTTQVQPKLWCVWSPRLSAWHRWGISPHQGISKKRPTSWSNPDQRINTRLTQGKLRLSTYKDNPKMIVTWKLNYWYWSTIINFKFNKYFHFLFACVFVCEFHSTSTDMLGCAHIMWYRVVSSCSSMTSIPLPWLQRIYNSMLKRKGTVENLECACFVIMVHLLAFFNCLLLWTVSSRIAAQSASGLVTTCLVELAPSMNLSISKVQHWWSINFVHCKIVLQYRFSLSWSEYF